MHARTHTRFTLYAYLSSKQDGNFKHVFAKFELSQFCFLILYGYILFFFSVTLPFFSRLNDSIYPKYIPALGFANCSEVKIVVSSLKCVVFGDNTYFTWRRPMHFYMPLWKCCCWVEAKVGSATKMQVSPLISEKASPLWQWQFVLQLVSDLKGKKSIVKEAETNFWPLKTDLKLRQNNYVSQQSYVSTKTANCNSHCSTGFGVTAGSGRELGATVPPLVDSWAGVRMTLIESDVV